MQCKLDLNLSSLHARHNIALHLPLVHHQRSCDSVSKCNDKRNPHLYQFNQSRPHQLTKQVNNDGKPRLTKFYAQIDVNTQELLIQEIYSLVSKRSSSVCNFLEGSTLIGGNDVRVIYRHYATLYLQLDCGVWAGLRKAWRLD